MELRNYQKAAVEAGYEHLRTKDTNPCVVIPTGGGKSLCLAQIAKNVVEKWNGRVLILAHVKELLEQNADKIRKLCPELKIGIYSAGLKSRDTGEQVIVAGIQSVYNKACDLGPFDIVIVDECHLLNSDSDDSMYKSFLKDMKVINPHIRLIGFTATPFRLKGGLICRPDNILNEVCYEAGLKEMIQQGYLSPLVSRAGRAEANLDGLHIRGGEFIGDEISSAMDKDELVSSACREVAELTRDRKSVLIFTSNIEHCRHVAEQITRFRGEECAVITGATPAGERAEIIARFKGAFVPEDLFGTPKPLLKFLCNVNVLTTGFDAVNTDCVVLLRPTNSAGLLVQMIGRGTRLSPATGKNNCLALIHAAYQKCPECGYEFPPPERSNITQNASTAGVISGQAEYPDFDVLDTFYAVHEKRYAEPDTPKTMRVDYQVGFNDFKSEWVCPEHTGYARGKFEKWWRERAALGCPIPQTAREAVALANEGLLAEPESITVKTVAGEKFERITGWRLKARPVMRESGDDSADADDWHSNSPEDIGFKTEPFDEDSIPF